MQHQKIEGIASTQALLLGERPRIVRLCGQLTGNRDAAEDLAQETLIAAWRNADQLRNNEAWQAWLSGIARNVCHHWARKHGRELSRSMCIDEGDDGREVDVADDFDLEIELERGELVELLDKALALLPPETRAVLVQRYVEESPHAEIAARLGLSENAIAVRLHRGRLALRQVLTRELRAEASTYGLIDPASDDAQQTGMWCPGCGTERLVGWLHQATGELMLRCSRCCQEPGMYVCRHDEHVSLLRDVKGFKVAYRRSMVWGHRYYRRALAGLASGIAPCWKCSRPSPLRLALPHEADIPPSLRGSRGVHVGCPICGGQSYAGLRALTMQLPEGRRFWQTHPRIRWLPEREIVAEGRPALVLGFESLRDTARLEIVCDRETFAPMLINGAPYVQRDFDPDA